MALINVATREIHCKIVYYGPGLSGKTTNLKYIHSTVPTQARGDLLSIDTETERTLFFDFLPLDLGRVHGYQTRFHLYTVPGQVLYERTRVAVLNGADGVVFVADSQRTKLAENVRSLQELAKNLTQQGKRFMELRYFSSISRGRASGISRLLYWIDIGNSRKRLPWWVRFLASSCSERTFSASLLRCESATNTTPSAPFNTATLVRS